MKHLLGVMFAGAGDSQASTHKHWHGAMVVVLAKPADLNRRLIAKVRFSALDARPTRFSGFRLSDTGFNRWPKR
jgi:hypothetical protein